MRRRQVEQRRLSHLEFKNRSTDKSRFRHPNVRHALIEGITTLEVTIGEFLRSKLEGDKELASAMQSFWSLPLSAQIVTVASIHGHIDLQDIKLVNRAIELRNKIAHEGE